VDLDSREHPLARALLASGPITLGRNGHGGADGVRTLLGRDTVHALTLPGADPAGLPTGLLLLARLPAAMLERARWAARVLGPRLAQLLAAEALAASDRRLQRQGAVLTSVIHAVTDPILLTDPEGRIIVANASAEALLATREDASEGRRRAVALNNMLFSAALSRHAIEGAEPARHELPLVDPADGSDLFFELLSTVTADPREGTGVVSILRDITDLRRATTEIEENYRRLRQAEIEARAERDRLDLIIDSVADPILVTDSSGNIAMMNTPAERLFTAKDQASEEARRAVQANDAHFSSFVSNLFFGDDARRAGTLPLVDPRTGAALPMEAVAGRIITDRGGEVKGLVTILHDQTEALERARLYEELKRASAELEEKVQEATAELVHQNERLRRSHIALEQASALKSQFLANMSHEFRTPLNAILGYTSMLLKGVSGALTETQRRNLARIESNGTHLLSIINDILDISRIEAGKMPLTLGEILLPDLVAEVLAEVEPLIARTRLAVTTDLEPGLPAVVSDRQKVKQILINLLTNALKFTPEGWVRVVMRHDGSADTVAIAVADSGIGIAEKDQDAIFEDFRQADNSPTRQFMGAGLGLAICRRLSEMLGGRLEVLSAPGAGATFTLTIPRHLEDPR
jgi:PAS domain S-box-containing protein